MMQSGGPYPPVAPYFMAKNWQDIPKADLEKHLMDAIIQDPEIQDKTNISLTYNEGGVGKEDTIDLIGKVSNEAEKKRAQQIIEVNTKNELKVNNQLAVG